MGWPAAAAVAVLGPAVALVAAPFVTIGNGAAGTARIPPRTPTPYHAPQEYCAPQQNYAPQHSYGTQHSYAPQRYYAAQGYGAQPQYKAPSYGSSPQRWRNAADMPLVGG